MPEGLAAGPADDRTDEARAIANVEAESAERRGARRNRNEVGDVEDDDTIHADPVAHRRGTE